MDNVKGILLLLTLGLAALCFILFIQVGTMRTQISDANVLSAATRELLRAQSVSCSASSEEMLAIAGCIRPLLQAKDFKQHAFEQPNTREGTPGYLVIKNTNKRTYEGEAFTFSFNREQLQQGCDVPGQVGLDVTCRFTFPQECAKGDILEVFYPNKNESVRVFLKTC